MVAAELGADYVMFGELEERRYPPSFEAVIERVAWWAEVFEVPCVGYAGGMDEVAPLATAGAEFVALRDWIFWHERGPATAGGAAGAGGDPRMRRARPLSRVVLSTLASALVVASAGAQTPPMPPALVPSAPISAAPVGSGAQVTPPAPRSEAQSLTPPAPRAPEPAIKERPKPRPQPAARPIPPPAANAPAPVPAVEAFPGATSPAAPAATSREVDVAYGAYQRGYYLTAFIQATKRIEAQGDMRSMTLLGELYANGFGMPQDDKKAAEWYRLAAERGDREAMFALA